MCYSANRGLSLGFQLGTLDLFDGSDFVPRSNCGPGWTGSLISLSQISNFLIFISYLIISILVFIIWIRKRGITKSWILLGFTSFIFLCGLTHLNNVLAFSWPAYRFFILIDFITMVVSVITASVLPVVVIYLFRSTPIQLLDQILEENRLLQKLSNDCSKIRDHLSSKIEYLEKELKRREWVHDKFKNLKEMTKLLEDNDR